MWDRKPIRRGTESELLYIHVYNLISRVLFRFKHHSRNVSVLLGKNKDQGPLKE